MKNAETLNDLMQINNDRVAGYDKAVLQTIDEDLRLLFSDMASQSRQFISELEKLVRAEGDEPTEGTTLRGKIYRTWMDVKATFGGDDRRTLLASCEFGEDAAQSAYRSALNKDDITRDVRRIIESQKISLKDAYDKIRKMRDAQLA